MVFRRTAASTPAGIAMASATSSDRQRQLEGDRELARHHRATDCRVRMDSPRSPRRPRPSQRRYWTATGSLSPYFSRISSRPAASASVPASTRAGSPGISRTPVKTMRLIRSSVIAEMNARRTRNSITAASRRYRPRPRRYCQVVPLIRMRPSGIALVALEVLGVGHDVVRVVEVDRCCAAGAIRSIASR